MTKKQVEQLLNIAVYFGEKVLFNPTQGNWDDKRMLKTIKDARNKYVRGRILKMVKRVK